MKNHSPCIHQIFQQNKAYDNHLRKLSDIRQSRKKNLTFYNSQRYSQIKHIQARKNNHFMNKFENNQKVLRKQNLSIYSKLGKVLNERKKKTQTIYLNTSSFKKLQQNRIRYCQNKRISKNITSSSSSIKNSQLKKQQKKRQQIKNRLRKYTDKSQLKCKSYLKCKSHRSQPDEILEKKPKISDFYNKTDILKNKLQKTPQKLNRPSTSSYRKRNKVTLKINSFFPTSQEL